MSPYFIDEYPAAIEAARRRVEEARLDACRSQAAIPRYEAALTNWKRLQHEYAGIAPHDQQKDGS